MSKVLDYLKYIGLFILLMFSISLITSLLNLTNINTSLINKITIILTIIIFFVTSTIASNNINDKGYLTGLKLGLILIILLILINLIFFKNTFNIPRIIYYIILLISSILGGSFGKNIKIKKLAR